MWICMNDGFVSAVQDRNDPDRLVVRARSHQHLINIFGPDVEVVESAISDYRYRTFVGKAEFADIVANRVASIDYDNFKNSVQDKDLHDLYEEFWLLHLRYQYEILRRRSRGPK